MSNLTVIENNGQIVVDSRLVAEELGIEHPSFIRAIKRYEEELMGFGGFALQKEPFETPGGIQKITFCYLNEKQLRLMLSKSRGGLSIEAIGYLASKGMDFSEFSRTPIKRAMAKESDYSRKLSVSLNGKREISTLAGNIDILTQTEVIEVKTVSMWKAALGQVLVYGTFYPSHKKRIHLYGETQESFLEMVRQCCSKFNVVVTWEP